ncbi:MAG: outer membrane beta-barrel protein [Crocinitomicaceae bacterium]|nr:porin family protein [Flavobacteriales bacterium]NQZ36587.1 outer membrane beta-barrel protein [Crocinitomicaceae bacterium]
MKKIYSVALVCLSLISFNSMAQMSIGLGGGLLKSTEDNAESLLGGELTFKYGVTDEIRVGANLGYYQTSEEILSTKFTSSLVPISVSGEYMFLEDKFRPYVGLHLGLLKAGFKVGDSKASDSYFSLAPVIGVDYEVSDQLGINFNFKYGFAFYKNDFTDEMESFSTISPNIGVYYKL